MPLLRNFFLSYIIVVFAFQLEEVGLGWGSGRRGGGCSRDTGGGLLEVDGGGLEDAGERLSNHPFDL